MKFIAFLIVSSAFIVSCTDSTSPEYPEGVFIVDSLSSTCSVHVDEHDSIVSSYRVRFVYHFEESAGTVISACCSISVMPGKMCLMPIIDPTPDCYHMGQMQDCSLGSGRLEDWSGMSSAMVYVRAGGKFWHCSIFNNPQEIGSFFWEDSIEVEIVNELE